MITLRKLCDIFTVVLRQLNNNVTIVVCDNFTEVLLRQFYVHVMEPLQ